MQYTLHYSKSRVIGRWKKIIRWYNQSFSEMIDILKNFPSWTFYKRFHTYERTEKLFDRNTKTNNFFVDDSNAFSTVFDFKTPVHHSPLNFWWVFFCFFLSFVFFFRAFATEAFCIETKFHTRLLNWTLNIVDISHGCFFHSVPSLQSQLRAFKKNICCLYRRKCSGELN